MMSPMEARIALAELIALLFDERGMDRAEFSIRTSFFDKATLSRYLGGYSKLRIEQLADLLETLELTKNTERRIILLFLCQHHGPSAVDLINRHFDREDDEPFEL
jgi:predicted transcriptional regulator